ncbi:TetR/AcrR family transcriptional regulator [Pseudonocardia spirodelae]|uniref:TetR/AcrR family transcriptional regulator n=1 Tax=Pseudonocardia spirodelae TaxID=3133431 RepID=A0ABU8T7A6_9PSEU
MGEPERRRRRSAEEVRSLLLLAAARAFVDRGYAQTSTREIAGDAGVSQPLLFRHFGGKAGLFTQTVVAGFAAACAEFAERWWAPIGRDEPRARAFLRDLFDVLAENREAVVAMVGVYAYEADSQELSRGVVDVFAALLGVVRDVLLCDTEGTFLEGVDDVDTPAVVLAALLGCAVFDDWLFDAQLHRPENAVVIEELSTIVLHGFTHRQG